MPRRWLVALLVILAAACPAVAAPSPASAANEPLPVFTADFGDRLGHITGAEAQGGGEFAPGPEGLSARMIRSAPGLPDNAINQFAQFIIAAPDGQRLAEGDYQGARIIGSATVPTLNVGMDGMGCGDQDVGAFVVSDVAHGSDGNVSRLAASYVTTCWGQQVAGEIRWRSPEPYTAISVSDRRVDFGAVAVGTSSEAHRLSLRNVGTAPVAVSSVDLVGTEAGAFSAADDCTGQPIAVGSTCALDLVFSPSVVGRRAADLYISDTTFKGMRHIPLQGTTIQETTGEFLAPGISPGLLPFGDQRIGTVGEPQVVTLTGPLDLTQLIVDGAAGDDFLAAGDCDGPELAGGESCRIEIAFAPTAYGPRRAELRLGPGGPGHSVALLGTGTLGYFLGTSDGVALGFGDAPGDAEVEEDLNHPIVGLTTTPTGEGVWLVASDGGIFSFGDATFYGSTGSLRLNQPIVGMAPTPSGEGYWLVASDGGIFSFGDATFYGSTGSLRLNQPIVGMAPTPSGKGYWLVASDGGMFAFGDAGFFGSTGSINLNRPIVGMAPTPSGSGYHLVATDGGIFSFGDADFHGSTGAIHLNQPIAGMATTPTGAGYWLVADDGGIFSFGDATFEGSAGDLGIDNVIGIAPTARSTQLG